MCLNLSHLPRNSRSTTAILGASYEGVRVVWGSERDQQDRALLPLNAFGRKPVEDRSASDERLEYFHILRSALAAEACRLIGTNACENLRPPLPSGKGELERIQFLPGPMSVQTTELSRLQTATLQRGQRPDRT